MASDVVWSPSGGELIVRYDATQREAFEEGQSSEFDLWAWPREVRNGRNKHGCFPEVAVQAHFENLGYSVLVSEPQFPDDGGFILLHFTGLRRKGHPAFRRMESHFPDYDLNGLADSAIQEKKMAGLSGRGGDPDLFVFRSDSSEKFFVEVKDNDKLHSNQAVCFPIIENYLQCAVRVVRVEPFK